jgi:hypothetical protein
VVRAVPGFPRGGKHFHPYDEQVVTELARTASSRGEILVALGAPRESWYFHKLAFTAALYNIALPVNEGKPDRAPAWECKTTLEQAFCENTTMEGVCRQLGVSPSGATHTRIRESAQRLGIELPVWAIRRADRRPARTPDTDPDADPDAAPDADSCGAGQ